MPDNEAIKYASRQLRGTLAEELAADAPEFSAESVQLLKFHGSYQQDDRDQRRARRGSGQKAYQFMVRARIPGGALTADQYRAFDELADAYGNGSIRLTMRQSIQLHGVIKADLKATIGRINDALLSTLAACGDVNRNVMACPAPLRTRADAQVQEHASALAMRLAPRTRAYHEIWLDGERLAGDDREPLYGVTYLPRKFKIGVAHPGDNCVDVLTQDLGFVAELDGERLLGFVVVVGGGMGSTHGKAETYPRLATPLAFIKPQQLLDVAETVIALYRDNGDRTNRKHARLKYVVEERGVAWVREEVETRLGYRLEDPHAIDFDAHDDHLGWHPQNDGRFFLGLHVGCGRVSNDGLAVKRALRAVVDRFSPGVRITGQQNVLLTDLHAAIRGDVETQLREYGVEPDPRRLGLRRHAMACPALPTCGLAVAEAERALPYVVEALERELIALGSAGEKLGVRMTGCPNGCARPRMGDIGIVGRSLDLYDVYAGGDWSGTRLNLPLAQSVKLAEIAAVLRPALARWLAERRVDEAFGDFVHRTGVDSAAAAC